MDSATQAVWLRKTVFQIHLWAGIGLGLYVLLINVTGSIIVYRNELFRTATPDPIVVTPSGPPLTDPQFKATATRLYPGYTVDIIGHPPNPNQAVGISLKGPAGRKSRLFNPFPGTSARSDRRLTMQTTA